MIKCLKRYFCGILCILWGLTTRRIDPKPFFLLLRVHPAMETMTAACVGPAFSLGVVASREFDLCWISTPLRYFLHLRCYALHFGGLSRRDRKADNTISLISACGSVVNITAACEGPVFALWVVVAAHFDLRCKATPPVFFFGANVAPHNVWGARATCAG